MKIKKINAAAILITTAIAFAGCSKTDEPADSKINNANKTAASPVISSVSPNVAANENVMPGNSVSSVGGAPVGTTNSGSPAAGAQNMKSVSPVKQPTPVVGTGGEDFFLLSQVRGALGTDKDLINSVIVEIKAGNATLTGKVADDAQKKRAEQLVRGVKGIVGVKNDLRVSP